MAAEGKIVSISSVTDSEGKRDKSSELYSACFQQLAKYFAKTPLDKKLSRRRAAAVYLNPDHRHNKYFRFLEAWHLFGDVKVTLEESDTQR
jgi:hypothetical protein